MTSSRLSGVARASLAFAVLAAGSVAGVALVAPPAVAAPPAECIDAIYSADNASGNIRPVSITGATTGQLGAVLYDGTPPSDNGAATSRPNQLGIGAGGAIANNTNNVDIVEWQAASGTTTRTTKVNPAGANAVAGAVNPQNQLYYYGGYNTAANQLTLFAYDPQTNTPLGQVATISIPSPRRRGSPVRRPSTSRSRTPVATSTRPR